MAECSARAGHAVKRAKLSPPNPYTYPDAYRQWRRDEDARTLARALERGAFS